MPARVVIVGAGLAGLACAVTLARRGVPVLLLERAPVPGGLCRSFALDDVIFDYGPHVLFEDPGDEGARLAREVLPPAQCLQRPFAFAIQAPVPDGGRYYAFPNHKDVFSYPWRYKTGILKGLLGKKPPLRGEPSARDELVAKGGDCFYEELFRQFLTKKTLQDPQQLHVHWLARVERTARQELEPPPRSGHVGRVLGALRRLKRPYFYPTTGFQAYTDALFKEFTEHGGEAICSCGPLQVRVAGGRVQAVVAQGEAHEVSHLVWTAPLNTLNRLLEAGVPTLPALDMALVCLTFACESTPRRPFVYVYHPDSRMACNRTYYPHSIFREHSPAGREGICFEYTMTPELSTMDDAALLRTALADSHLANLYDASSLRASRVVRLPQALPVYPLDYQQQLAAALAPARALQNCLAVGRQGGFLFCMTPTAASQGLKAAREVLQSLA
ncbi:MAG: FAD-dependent oxidoreductase [Desulfovibrio sp.]|nr:FAD-dependent oxidoreductase [Desulfovibrio sp.]MCA1987104.1 FAD-dependent oxidoreductase [Desulfovibrio sp.]